MFAVIRTGGKQYRVAEGETVRVDRLEGETGAEIRLEDVLMVKGDDSASVGSPTVDGAYIDCTIVQQGKGKKIRVFKYKAKKDSEKTIGHRHQFTELKVNKIVAG